jgi:hypothetical protein
VAAVWNVNDVLDGHVALDVECLDRIYLNAYVPNLQVGGQVVSFLTAHRPVRVPALRAGGDLVSAPRSRHRAHPAAQLEVQRRLDAERRDKPAPILVERLRALRRLRRARPPARGWPTSSSAVPGGGVVSAGNGSGNRGMAPWSPDRRTLVIIEAIEEVLEEERSEWPLGPRSVEYRLLDKGYVKSLGHHPSIGPSPKSKAHLRKDPSVPNMDALNDKVVSVLARGRRSGRIPWGRSPTTSASPNTTRASPTLTPFGPWSENGPTRTNRSCWTASRSRSSCGARPVA